MNAISDYYRKVLPFKTSETKLKKILKNITSNATINEDTVNLQKYKDAKLGAVDNISGSSVAKDKSFATFFYGKSPTSARGL